MKKRITHETKQDNIIELNEFTGKSRDELEKSLLALNGYLTGVNDLFLRQEEQFQKTYAEYQWKIIMCKKELSKHDHEHTLNHNIKVSTVENKKIIDTIKRVLPEAIYSFDETSGYWEIGMKDDADVVHNVKISSADLSNWDYTGLNLMIKSIGMQICAKMCNEKEYKK